LAVAAALFGVLFALMGWRAFQLQVLDGERLRRMGERQHLKEWIVLPKRGSVFDRSGEPLAVSLEAQSVYARPRLIKDLETASRGLARALGLDAAELERRFKAGKPFVWVKRQVSPKEAERVRELNIVGVGTFYEPNRYYPHGQLAGQMIGFVGRDSQGLEGLELSYDQYIKGETRSSVVERDALGRRVLARGLEEIQMPPGADIHLTFDASVQYLAEKELEAAVVKFRAKAGIAIAVEPFKGEILALANYPFFNPNQFVQRTPNQWRNRAVTDSFEPGSTFKTILAAAALEEGVVGKEDLFYCENGKYSFAGRTIHDTHEYGWIPFSKIIQYSSNIGVTKVAEKLKRDRYFGYIEKFGFGRLTGVDLPGEVPGAVRSPDRWAPIDLATHAFGQGIAVTPLQLAMAYAAVANGGFLMRPYVVRRVVAPGGETLVENQPHVIRRVISEKTARTLTTILKGVIDEGGTGVMAEIEGFDVAGKTGTAQKPDLVRGGYSAKKRVASFVGFVPADDPRVVLAVVVDEPEVNVYGGVVAAPVFRNIATGVLRHLSVAPERPEPPALPALKPVRADKWRGEDPTDPNAPFAVPDFTGLSLREALERARALKLRIEVRGSGYVVKQFPVAGSPWDGAEILTLSLQG
jgi:cell division protein FtsI (penicillin-binding protein 3)